MKIIWTVTTNNSKILLNINTAAFQLSCGDTVTVDRRITVIEPLKELGNNMYRMTWLDVILWRVNDTYMEDITPMPPEVSTRLFKECKFSSFEFDDEIREVLEPGSTPDITIIKTEYEH